MRRRSLLLLLAASGCAAPPPPPPTLQLTLSGGAGQNPDPAGHPTAVAVRLYQLAGPGSFAHADALSLIEREKTVLGPDLLAGEEILLSPGETKTITRAVKPGTTLLGVAVLFRDIDHATWRASAPVAANGPTRLRLATTADAVMLVGA